MLQVHIMKKIGCTPPYWIKLKSYSSGPQYQNPCTPKDFEEYAHMFQFRRAHEEFSLQYQYPCTEMKRSVNKETLTGHNLKSHNEIILDIKYPDQKYMEIMNIKVYDSESLLSQVGGFIGI